MGIIEDKIDEGIAGKTAVPKKISKKAVETAIDAKGKFDEVKSAKILLKAYKGEAKRDVVISPMYAPYFGNIMRVSINGIAVSVPCNGSRCSIPETHAAEITRRIAAVDKQLALQRGLQQSPVLESKPGDIPIV